MAIVKITCGLPGSGKSTWAQKELKGSHDTRVLTVDNYRHKHDPREFADYIARQLPGHGYNNLIIDGLFTTQVVYEQLLTALVKYQLTQQWVEFHLWEEDRATCLFNDQGRRDVSAGSNIAYMPLEAPDLERLQAIYGRSRVVMHKVVKKDSKHTWLDTHGHTLKSATWCLGGEWASYDGYGGKVNAEPPLAEFDEFDDLLLAVAPQVNFLQYKKIKQACVTTQQEHHSDYYSNGTDHAYYECDLEKLYDVLVELGLMT